MINKVTVQSDIKIFETVDSSIRQTQTDILPIQSVSSTITTSDNIDLDTILENLKKPETAIQSLCYLTNFHDLNSLLNQKTELIPLILTFVSPNTPNLIIPSLQFIEKCCSIQNFPAFLLNFISLQNLSELAFTINSKQAIIYIDEIISSIVLLVGQSAEQDILQFITRTDQLEVDSLKAASINILHAYLQNTLSYTEFLQNIDLINRLNLNLLMINFPKQLIATLKTIDFCIKSLDIPCASFNASQIIKLIKCNIISIQVLSISIITTILLRCTSDDFALKSKLCKSLHWTFVNGSIKSKLKALFCLRTFIDLCSDQFPPIMELLDDNFFDSLFNLLSSGNNGSIEAISFLIFLVQADSHPQFKQRAIQSILDFDIHEQLESLASTEDKIIASHSLVLLNMTERLSDIQSEAVL
ncbi:hypothetical protein M9Y10_023121 [Tritrichomonas musculus]|uniref:Uncharacterized protein n=1 Tax=Tritrichomonas musculus TaxID=1915356 RepID=A0ABR2KU89_9EUKA